MKHTPTPWSHWGDDCIHVKGELIAQTLRGGSRQLPITSNRNLIVHRINTYETLVAALEKLTNAAAKGHNDDWYWVCHG